MAAALPISVLAIFVALCSFQISPAVGGENIAGGWNPIKDLAAPAVVRVAKFALTTYNNATHYSGSPQEFERVLEGEIQVVAGLKYRLVIAAVAANRHSQFQAIVLAKPGGKALKLLSFNGN